jgi:hypothetical protein
VAIATEPAERFWASAAVVHRSLEEQNATGARLLTERGPMLQLRLGARHPVGAGGVIAAELLGAGGALDYDGQTQGGAPLQTQSDHWDVGGRLLWRPVAAQSWGEPWLVLDAFRNRRNIAGTGPVSGLSETSSAVLAGLRWQSPPHQVGSLWQVRLEVDALLSVRHRLDVDFQGLFDSTGLEGGRQRRTAVRLVGTTVHSPWDWTLEWSHLNQSVSPAAPLTRRSVVAGTVRQPRLTTDDVALRVTRRF